MTLIDLEGFDDGQRNQRWISVGQTAPTLSARNRLGLCQDWPVASGVYMTYAIPAALQHDTITVGLWWHLKTYDDRNNTPDLNFLQFNSDSNTTIHISVHPTPTGQLRVNTWMGEVGVTDVIWGDADTNHYIEVEIKLGDAPNGTVRVWSDGTLMMDVSGVDTKSGGTKTVFDTIRFRSNPRMSLLMDDVYLLNGDGPTPGSNPPDNERFGDIVVDTLFPNGNGAHSDFTGQDGDQTDNYAQVDEAPTPDGDATYVESAADGDRDSYGHTDMAYANGAVVAAIACATARNTGSADNLQLFARIAGNDYDGDPIAAPAGYGAGVTRPLVVSPASGGPWSIAEINAAEFGYENVP